MSIALSRQRSPRYLNLIYPVPNPLVSLEEWRRLNHLDLQHRQTAQLARERFKVHSRLMLSDERDPWGGWLEERLVAIEDELAGRRTVARSIPAHAAPRRGDATRIGGGAPVQPSTSRRDARLASLPGRMAD